MGGVDLPRPRPARPWRWPRAGPLTPAAFRDETGTSRRYVLVILEDLDRRGLLRRTDAGHVLGPTTVARMRERRRDRRRAE